MTATVHEHWLGWQIWFWWCGGWGMACPPKLWRMWIHGAGRGIAREYLQGRRLNHAVVAGCGAEVSILQQMSLESDGDGFGAVGGADLHEDCRKVFFHTERRESELCADFLVRKSTDR